MGARQVDRLHVVDGLLEIPLLMNVASRSLNALKALMAAAIGFASLSAGAQAPIPGYPDTIDAFDPREVAMLPPYCAYTHYFRAAVPGGNDREKTEAWRSTLGPTFEHIHHYCFGLMKTNRGALLARSRQSRLFYLNDALLEYDYVIQRAPRDFVLLPEILTRKADNLLLLERYPLAIYNYELAIEAKPDYWPPYAKLADHYRDHGNPAKAKSVLEAGLKAAPAAPALERRLAELAKP